MTMTHLNKVLLTALCCCAVSYLSGQELETANTAGTHKKPNILLIIADDLSKTLPIYGDSTITTPGIAGVATGGVVFERAYCTASSCTPSRASILTSRYPHQLTQGGNLHGTLPLKYENYALMLADNGYRVGLQGKGWGPGNFRKGGYTENPAGKSYKSFEDFMQNQPDGTPF